MVLHYFILKKTFTLKRGSYNLFLLNCFLKVTMVVTFDKNHRVLLDGNNTPRCKLLLDFTKEDKNHKLLYSLLPYATNEMSITN